MATACAGALLLSCSSDPDDQLEASVETPEPAVEPSPSGEPEASKAEAPPLGEDEPLFAPLPELTPDPDNDVPDDLEQIILDAFAEAYDTELGMYAAGELDEEALRVTHFGDGFDATIETVEYLEEQGGRELSPDTKVTSVFVVEFEGGGAILRECFTTGPKSGLYSDSSFDVIEQSPQGSFARDRMLEFAQWDGDSEPRYRVSQVGFAPTDGC